MKIPITQTKKWQKLQQDLGNKTFFEKRSDFEYLAIEKHTPVGNYLFLPYGPVAKSDRGFLDAINSLIDLARNHHCIFIRLEPQDDAYRALLPMNSKKVKDVEPAETWILDLPEISTADPLDDHSLKALLPSRLLRYYKNIEKQGITIETSHNPADIHYLVELQSALAAEKGITTFTADYLKTELEQDFATLYLLSQHMPPAMPASTGDAAWGTPTPACVGENAATGPVETDVSHVLAAGLVFDDATTRYNLQGAQSETGRKLHATGILTIELILDAVRNGQKTFDFWGIAPEGAPATHPWAGFTAFKKTFAGREVKYAGTYDLPTDPLRYRLYQFLRRFRH